MSELLEIDREITGKYAVEQSDRIALLERLMNLVEHHPAPVIADVVVRALEREVWRLAPDQSSEYLLRLIDALDKLQWSYTRMWRETPEDQVSSAVERAERLEKALSDPSFSDDERAQVIFNQLKGLRFGELDARWDVLYTHFDALSPAVHFAVSYAICVNSSADTRHPMFEQAVGLVADQAVNSEDKRVLADALIALRAAQGMSLAASTTVEHAQDQANRKFISRFE